MSNSRCAVRALCAAVAMGLGPGGCSGNREPPEVRAYVSIDRLIALHPARSVLGDVSPAAPREELRAEEDPVGVSATPPEALRPFGLASPSSGSRSGVSSAGAEERLRELASAAERRTGVAMARRARLDVAVLEAERAEAYRAAETRIAERQAGLRDAARAEIRATDLRIVALEAQIGSPAAGPPEAVQAALTAARETRKNLERRLSQDLAQVRNDESQAARDRLEQRETALSRSREIEEASRAADAARSVRLYEASLRGAEAQIPSMVLPDQPAPLDLRNVATRSRFSQQARDGGRPATWRGPALGSAETFRAALRADVEWQVRRIARKHGWAVQFVPASGVPDRTAEVAQALKAEWDGT